MNIEIAKDVVVDIRTKVHTNCVVCSPSNTQGLKLEFAFAKDGSVSACFDCGRQYGSYAGILHDGVLSMILDDAMTNCLFAHVCLMFVSCLFHVCFMFPYSIPVNDYNNWLNRRLDILDAFVENGGIIV